MNLLVSGIDVLERDLAVGVTLILQLAEGTVAMRAALAAAVSDGWGIHIHHEHRQNAPREARQPWDGRAGAEIQWLTTTCRTAGLGLKDLIQDCSCFDSIAETSAW